MRYRVSFIFSQYAQTTETHNMTFNSLLLPNIIIVLPQNHIHFASTTRIQTALSPETFPWAYVQYCAFMRAKYLFVTILYLKRMAWSFDSKLAPEQNFARSEITVNSYPGRIIANLRSYTVFLCPTGKFRYGTSIRSRRFSSKPFLVHQESYHSKLFCATDSVVE